ncbi:MAG: N-acetylmuramoyl-L-alanine amidase [Bacteroidales bacterium]|nr:N-acetylmuramoyl-L-alanine amidase [Bacteroidales bacterium]
MPLPTTRALNFAVESLHYAFCFFANNHLYRSAVGMAIPKVELQPVFGDLLPVLQSDTVKVFNIENTDNQKDNCDIEDIGWGSRSNATDYPNAIWMPAGTCNYSSRNGHRVSAITIHYTQGTYSGSIAWFQNCSYNGVGAQASAHYVLRSVDGQVAQMVRETDKAWHVGNSNSYTIGLEHEAYGDIASYFTPAMYQSSAQLTRDICERHGISPLRMFYRDTLDNGSVLNYGLHDLGGETSCVKIRGHQHFPSQTHTDPGPYWDWNYYFKLVNADTPVTTFHSTTGTFTDSGGETGDYGNDERKLYLIQVPEAENITLTFSAFDLENDYDFMWIYDGNTVFAPQLGRWNTTSPGTVVSSGNSLLVEFRSDCATTASGWVARWSASVPVADAVPTTVIRFNSDDWVTSEFNLGFEDSDDHGVAYRFYQVMGYDGSRWTANVKRGFACDNFDDFNTTIWHIQNGSWTITDHRLSQSSMQSATIYAPLKESALDAYLFDIYASVENCENNANLEFILSANRDEVRYSGTAYSVRVKPMEHRMEILRWVNGDVMVVDSLEHIFISNGVTYRYRIVCDRSLGRILVFRDARLLMDWQDQVPLALPGQHMLIHTEGLRATFDNWRVYKSRERIVHIYAGPVKDSELPWQAMNGEGRAKIKSIVLDDAYQFSSLVEKTIKSDFSGPVISGSVHFCFSTTVESVNNNIVNAQWSVARDDNSEVAYYDYEIWDENNASSPVSTGRTTTNKFDKCVRMITGHRYYVRVAAVNCVGLRSRYIISNSIEYQTNSVNNVTSASKNRNLVITVTPTPAREYIEVGMMDSDECEKEVVVYDAVGRLMFSQKTTNANLDIDISSWKSGLYVLQIRKQDGSFGTKKIVKQ